jgi:DNA-binding transcriptional LysR family regulator
MKAGKLVQVLAPFAPICPGVFLYYPGHRQLMPKLRAFIDHVKARAKAGDKTPAPADRKRKRGANKR